MNKNIKTILLIVVVIIVIGVIAIFGSNILNKNENVNETQNSINETNQNMKIEVNETENNVVNETQNNTTENEVENKQVENNIENNNTTTQNIVTNETTEVLQNDGASNEEKAINIVKSDWGTTENVYFVTMGIDASGKYIVTVNDSSTTATLAWYRSRCSYREI
ncbi:MAG: hypothetical protein J6D03_01770 [Clostridia bacterium]|nr:hypothetical protein [Clostridia bacterium]